MENCVQAFEPYIALNSHVRKPVIHISLNPCPKDILSEKQMTVLAQEFMEKFGYGNQPYIVWLHEDIKRKHMHIVSVRINEQGEKIDHNREAIRAQNICREMEVKYGLHPTLGEHGERELVSLQKVDYPKGDVKMQVKHTARTLLECYNFHSLAEYNTLLNLYNVTAYEVRGSVDGKEYHGIMYGALDDDGQQVGTPFKSSKFGKVFGYETLQKKFAASVEKVKRDNLAERTRKEVVKAMQGISTKEEFARRLKEADIEVIYRINPDGRLYGITFIDHAARTVFNGSRLGKPFTANVFNELFNNPDADRKRLIPVPEQEASRQERETRAEERQESEEYRRQENQSHHQSESSGSLIDTSALGAVDIFSVLMEDDHTHEYIDPAFRYGRKKKKKRRRKL
ncbi:MULTISPECIES: conjugal transfer protein MobB [Bacteroidaceae]|uniref:conjugal transfer protein MobB n=1 Tax=Bacteroidaceae TaxID=815 RepID=UPI001107118F|nr:relaxase/mobilization nuclease domain-containing protein [Bacteroides uniformis]MBE5079086.1 relaxase/mobilization nuclease domain-containing protein [Phocaeicola dorei]MCE9167680.1 relaxase/mobilization nuclease domain-containing protein [Bacteroides ovatus]KAB4194226.1 relaxase/mobilization nuclease domain-containing protein [Bacteroides uniformis]KAB4200139.1 relaxase/mobilization nuclease domain-containing protein [Bacteroides uniformis]